MTSMALNDVPRIQGGTAALDLIVREEPEDDDEEEDDEQHDDQEEHKNNGYSK
jgi:hypothetical protein